ncbi:MAG: DUF3493 domain-containing protein [Parasynechococcus sp.]
MRLCLASVLDDNSTSGKGLDPALRERLIRESRTPWRGLRRLLWFALFASAGLGLFTMLFRASAGDSVDISDFGIQGGALVLFASLLWFDRNRSVDVDQDGVDG